MPIIWRLKDKANMLFYTKCKHVKLTLAWEHRDHFPYFSGTISSSHDLLKTSVTVGGGVSDHMSTGSTTSLASYDSMRRLASQVVAYHFCDQSIIDTCQVPEFIHSIAAQLTQSPFLSAYKVGWISLLIILDNLSIIQIIASVGNYTSFACLLIIYTW